ncbi:hypothetical protein ACOSQ3_007469 [Xanthoceras sorbifolium]
MKREFLNLKQRQMSVTEYEREFTRLSKYASEILVTEEDKCRRFEDGLNDYIRVHITAFEYDDYSRLISAALNVERVKKEEQARKEINQNKRNPGQSSSNQQHNKKFKGFQGLIKTMPLRVAKEDLGNLQMSRTEHDILVTNPLGHSVVVNKLFTHRQMDNLRR